MSVLIFVKSADGNSMRALGLENGCVIPDIHNLDAFDITNDEGKVRTLVSKMTIDGINTLIDNLGMHANRRRARKDLMVKGFMEAWHQIRENASLIANHGSSSSAGYAVPSVPSQDITPFAGTPHQLTDGAGDDEPEVEASADENSESEVEDENAVSPSQQLTGNDAIDALIQDARSKGVHIHILQHDIKHHSPSSDETGEPISLVDFLEEDMGMWSTKMHAFMAFKGLDVPANATLVSVKEFKGKTLMSIYIVPNETTGLEAKEAILSYINTVASKKTLTLDSFYLIQGQKKKVEDNDLMTNDDIILFLRLRGGGKPVMSTIYKNTKQTKQEILEGISKDLMSNIVKKSYTNSPLLDAQGMAKYLHGVASTNDAKNAEVIFGQMVSSLTLANAEKCIEVMSSSGKQYGGTEQKLEKLTKEMFLGKFMSNLEVLGDEIKELQQTLITQVVRLYGIWASKGGRYVNAPFIALLEQKVASLKSPARGSEESDDQMKGLADMLSKASIAK